MMEQLHDSSSSDSDSELSMSTITSSSSYDTVSLILTSGSSLSDSELSSSKSLSVQKSPTCFYDPSTYKYQLFSIPEKIVYYMAKNCTNPETFQKLIETCKYFFKVNPVVVVSYLKSDSYKSSGNLYYKWSVSNYDKTCFEFKNPQTLNFKLWVTHTFVNYFLSTSALIPKMYKNDASYVHLRTNDQDITWEEFLFIAGNAESLNMSNQTIKYENGEIVPFEVIVESLQKLKFLDYFSNDDGSDFTSNTFNKLMEIQHFKNIHSLSLYNVPENVNVETIFNFILENKHIEICIRYSIQTSDAYKVRIREYSNRLIKEERCKSKIGYIETNGDSTDGSYLTFGSFSEDDDSDIFSDNFDDDEGLLFPWNNEDEEGWELPWDI